ncbi:MAG: cadherin repeat domain-containing protein [Calditrichia bacterium]
MNLPDFASVSDNGNGTGNIQLTPGFEDSGSYTLSAIVTDDGTPNLSDTVSFSLTINEVNRAPIWSTVSRNQWMKTAAFRCRFRRVIRMATAFH